MNVTANALGPFPRQMTVSVDQRKCLFFVKTNDNRKNSNEFNCWMRGMEWMNLRDKMETILWPPHSTHPNASLCDTSKLCQYSSGTYQLWTIKTDNILTANSPRNTFTPLILLLMSSGSRNYNNWNIQLNFCYDKSLISWWLHIHTVHTQHANTNLTFPPARLIDLFVYQYYQLSCYDNRTTQIDSQTMLSLARNWRTNTPQNGSNSVAGEKVKKILSNQWRNLCDAFVYFFVCVCVMYSQCLPDVAWNTRLFPVWRSRQSNIR